MLGLGLSIKNEYAQGNKLVYSKVKQYDNSKATCRHLCLKYVLRGQEQYQIANSAIVVGPGEFLLLNPGQAHGEYVQSETEVAGICMSLSKEILQDVYTASFNDHAAQLDNPLSYLSNPIEIYEGVFKAAQEELGACFSMLSSSVPSAEFQLLDSYGFYSTIAEKLLEGQGRIQKKIAQVKAERYATRKELYRRIEIGKKMIEQNFAQHLDIDQIASSSAMSTYHFTRTFTQVLRVSPYQYAIHCRLEAAKKMLKESTLSLSEIAFLVGFADIFTFSKSFKSAVGLPPSSYRKHC